MQNSLILIVNFPDEAHCIGDINLLLQSEGVNFGCLRILENNVKQQFPLT